MKLAVIAARSSCDVNRIWRAINDRKRQLFRALLRVSGPAGCSLQPDDPSIPLGTGQAQWRTTTYHDRMTLPTRKSKVSSAKQSATSD